jgi:hypothetical protein
MESYSDVNVQTGLRAVVRTRLVPLCHLHNRAEAVFDSDPATVQCRAVDG